MFTLLLIVHISSRISGVKKKRIYLEEILEMHIHTLSYVHMYTNEWLLLGDVAITNDSNTPQNYLQDNLTSQKNTALRKKQDIVISLFQLAVGESQRFRILV